MPFKNTPVDNDTFIHRDEQWQNLLQGMAHCTVADIERYSQNYWQALENADRAAEFTYAEEVRMAARAWMRTGDRAYLGQINLIGNVCLYRGDRYRDASSNG